jgi:hypothetical protein
MRHRRFIPLIDSLPPRIAPSSAGPAAPVEMTPGPQPANDFLTPTNPTDPTAPPPPGSCLGC